MRGLKNHSNRQVGSVIHRVTESSCWQDQVPPPAGHAAMIACVVGLFVALSPLCGGLHNGNWSSGSDDDIPRVRDQIRDYRDYRL